MIKILPRYIIKNIFTATLVTALVIVSVLLLITMLGELKSIGEGDYDIQEALWYALLSLPNHLYEFSPMLILLGSILGLSQLATHNELMIMRASGFSTTKIIRSVLTAACCIILLLGVIGEVLGPNLSYKAEVHKENERNAGQAVVTKSGIWLHLDNNFIHINNLVSKRLLEGVTRYEFDGKHHLQIAYYAEFLSLENYQWKMNDVVLTKFNKDRTSSESFKELAWNLKLNPHLFTIGLVEPAQMDLLKLAKFSHYLRKNNLEATEYEFNFWQRVFQPFSTLIMVFLALPWILTAQTVKGHALGKRMVLGILIGFIFFILNALLSQLSIVYQLPAMFAALLPLVLFATAGLILVRKI